MFKYALNIVRHPTVLILAMCLWTGLVLYLGFLSSVVKAPIIPSAKSDFLWQAEVVPEQSDGNTYLTARSENSTIEYDFRLSAQQEFPYVAYNFNFVDAVGGRSLADLKSFDSLSFEASCDPRNILILVLFTYDDRTTDINDGATYRVNSHFFTCNLLPERHTVRLDDFATPDWWLQNSGLELVDRNYNLGKVISFGFVNSLQSPRNTDSKAIFSKLAFVGKNWFYVYLSIAIVTAMWVFFIIWIVRRYIAIAVSTAKEKMREDLPLMAYKKLSLEPHKDKPKGELLRYLAEQYANPELSLDMVVNTIGINRNKINEILKDELGLTFTSYVNKLRLTEASRLLSEHPDEAVAQIAYKVGFNNVTYFNKLFKGAYGCSPKRFKEGVGDTSV